MRADLAMIRAKRKTEAAREEPSQVEVDRLQEAQDFYEQATHKLEAAEIHLEEARAEVLTATSDLRKAHDEESAAYQKLREIREQS